ncbi:hypothetical protein MICAI_1560002 [Microcystis sp. T1-4]|nr:hypothetical protein MICAI_1560002 [Microcystis sp. T1-4]
MINPTNKTVSDETKQLIDKLGSSVCVMQWTGVIRGETLI